MAAPEEIERWKKYQSRTAGINPRRALEAAIQFVEEKGSALDLGAGALNDAEFLIRTGFKEVVAVDITPQFREIENKDAQFTYFQGEFNEYRFAHEHFDLISAQYALPFSAEGFEDLWRNIYSSLKRGGILTCQLFGPNDAWSGRPNMIFHSETELKELLTGFTILKKEECEYTEKSIRAKHWHYFDLLLRKGFKES
jgi:SAM-dependent methyltransferase